ncbi:MAG: hypothetical protein NC936_01555 [Candidatus Omnitrophica bacterium]|nr:hypothetical protein [Candidatus Omnitrophota bacterium]
MKLKRYTKVVVFRASAETKEKLDEMAFKMRLTEGELLRKIFKRYLGEDAKKIPYSAY